MDALSDYSDIAVWSAIAVYALAFVLFTLDLSRRSILVTRAQDERLAREAAAAAQPGGAPVIVEAAAATTTGDSGPRYLRAALALTWVAWIIHLAATVMRGIAAERVPWANMYEFALTATAIIMGVFLIAQFWQDLKYLGAFVTGFVTLALGLAALNVYVPISPLPAALASGVAPIWLVIHIIVATLATGFFALGAALAILQLMRSRRDNGGLGRVGFLDSIPNPTRLEDLGYRLIVVGFVFWTFTLIAGSIWAAAAWGRYWGWDTKEVWTFVIWVLYAGYIHARATRGWRGTRSAWLAIIGFAAVVFNFSIVNIFFKGLHAYSGL